jgi:hypothetical protein
MPRKCTPETDAARFWSKVDQNGGPDACWPYLGFRDRDGYGDFWLRGQNQKAHRVAYLIANGEWPEPNGCHSCDNPGCCNPAHIFAGTVAQNMADRDAKGRHWVRHGEQHASARLTEADVREIRRRHAAGEASYTGLAFTFGVHIQTIASIVQRKTWKHVD